MSEAAAKTKVRLPQKLLSLEEAAKRIHVAVDRLRDLADANFVPHWRIDKGPPLFQITPLREWVQDNLTTQCGGRPLRITILRTPDPVSPAEVPLGIQRITPLFPLDGMEPRGPAVYFLCRGDDVVYVGQSQEPARRAPAHIGYKDFDRAYYVPIPADDLLQVEG
jgi:hypothetical protein